MYNVSLFVHLDHVFLLGFFQYINVHLHGIILHFFIHVYTFFPVDFKPYIHVLNWLTKYVHWPHDSKNCMQKKPSHILIIAIVMSM